jgi:LuxR family transcriptional regulator, activator of conjugal transfer of Ti plasmids
MEAELMAFAKQRLSTFGDRGYGLVIGIAGGAPRGGITTYPQEWLAEYFAKGLPDVDPILKWVALSHGSINWRDIPRDAAGQQMMDQAHNHGIENGTTIALVHNGEKLALSLCHTKPDLTEAEIREATAALLVVAQLSPRPTKPAPNQKELVYLRKLSEGLNDQEIGDELGLTLRAVRERKKKVIQEMGATNITHAVALAKDAGFV